MSLMKITMSVLGVMDGPGVLAGLASSMVRACRLHSFIRALLASLSGHRGDSRPSSIKILCETVEVFRVGFRSFLKDLMVCIRLPCMYVPPRGPKLDSSTSSPSLYVAWQVPNRRQPDKYMLNRQPKVYPIQQSRLVSAATASTSPTTTRVTAAAGTTKRWTTGNRTESRRSRSVLVVSPVTYSQSHDGSAIQTSAYHRG
jgi:hypothetical protein